MSAGTDRGPADPDVGTVRLGGIGRQRPRIVRIIIDTREQCPYEFPETATSQKHLETGDYSVEGYESVFAVERKTLTDLAGSVGQRRERFEAEIRRAQDLERFAIVVEGTRAAAARGQYYGRVHPNGLLGTCDAWELEVYDTLRFVWARTRGRAREKTRAILERWVIRTRAAESSDTNKD